VQHIAEIFGCPAVALYNAKTGEIFRGGAEELPDIEAKLKQVVMEGSRLRDDTLAAAIMLGGHPMGSIAMKCLTLSDGALHALLNLVAIALERVRTEEAANRAEASRQSEEFKSTLLDAIAHEFKTPLTSIKAASTSMLSDGVLPPPSRELVSIIDEEADRLSMLVTEAVRMAQIDAGKIRLERRAVDAGDLIHRVLAHFEPRSEGRAMHVTVDEGVPPAWADSELVSLALRQLIDNALKYSAQGSRLEIAVRAKDDSVEIRIRDHGPGIPVTEQERIFEKFYRRPGSKVPGTGLGLYIAREILRTHGGDVWVEGEPGWGSEFCVALPTQKEAARR
jgi:two-component system sensor histidine kinase KdpD